MGMAAAKTPAQGGKGVAPTVKPGITNTPTQPQSPYTPIGAQGGKGGVQQPGQPPYMPTGLPPAQVQPAMQPSAFNGPMGVRGNDQPPMPVMPTQQVPAQGGKGNTPLPAGYQSRYGNYGFDPGLQNYLDQQYFRSTSDAGVNFQYDPTTQTFTGGTMGGQYNPIPLSVMQQVAASNDQSTLSPYFQSRFPQQPAPAVKPGIPAQGGKTPPISAPFVDPVRPQVMPARPMPARPIPQNRSSNPTDVLTPLPQRGPALAPTGIAGLTPKQKQNEIARYNAMTPQQKLQAMQ